MCVYVCVFLNSCLKIPYTIAVYLKVYFTLTCDINMVRNHFDSGGRSLFDDLRALLLRLDSSVKFLWFVGGKVRPVIGQSHCIEMK